ncbi:hypothetical protein CSC2_30770 [Clostridium zeae]|uniref:Uncharacterized protein n=1 Tax=Clostridium zeae TaxID=2759022 RepID=A0ABQ1ECM4_9CLOT|nr:hypothetical protein [Clostridium zeae]GFZ32551.1 hypothetical protein CSC2_30770 [Clostridium zeae]
MKNKVAKIIFSVILLGAILIPSVGSTSIGVHGGTFTTQGLDTPYTGM